LFDLTPPASNQHHVIDSTFRWRGRQQQGVVITVALGESGAQRAGGVPSVLVKSSVRRAGNATLGVRCAGACGGDTSFFYKAFRHGAKFSIILVKVFV
jgi:hypothetical protein